MLRFAFVTAVALVIVCCSITGWACECDPNCAGSCLKLCPGCDSTCKINYGWKSFKCLACNSTGCNSTCNAAGIGKCDGPNCIANYYFNSTAQLCQPCDPNCAGGCATKGQQRCDAVCKTGYTLSSTFSCILCDVNCAGNCSTRGFGKCDSLCKTGFSLNASNVCVQQSCDPQCSSGCSSSGTGGCDSTCKAGYTLNTTSLYCYDTNECATNNGGCSTNATCTNTIGNFTCTCKTGFVGSGFTCSAMVNGSWSNWMPANNCTAGVVGVNQTLTRYCNNPTPANGGMLCINSTGGSATVESMTQPCPCDPMCNKTIGCQVKGSGLCDSVCVSGWSLASNFTCIPIVNGNWSSWYDTLNCTTAGQKNRTQQRDCNNPAPSNGGSTCINSNGSFALTETRLQPCPCDVRCNSSCTTQGFQRCDSLCIAGSGLSQTDFTCQPLVNGNWSSWYGIVNCTLPGQLNMTLQRDCNNPPPAFGGLPCINSSGVASSVDIMSRPCPCDVQCNSTCTVRGNMKCDSNCGAGWGLNQTDFTCQPTVNGNWSSWYIVSNCTSVGQLWTTAQRDCNNPAPAFGGLPCINGSGVESSVDIMSTACPCDPHCSSGCSVKGFQRCDSNCTVGWGLNDTLFDCRPSVNGNWSSWYITVNCTSFGQLNSIQQRDCKNPTPAHGGSLCITGSGSPSLNESIALSCPCDPKCASGCINQGFQRCDNSCIAGWGLRGTDFTCQPSVNGNWSDWYIAENCTAPGQLFSVLRRDCNNPAPAFGGLPCINGNGSPSMWETTNQSCPCDPKCSSACVINGFTKCDNSCSIGWSLNQTSFTCQLAFINGNWSDWYDVTNCTVPGQLGAIQKRDCNNPEPSMGGMLCINASGLPSMNETRTRPCPCDKNCNSSCSANGFLKCDVGCVAGWGINSTDRTCYPCNSTNCNGSCNAYGPGTCDGPCNNGFGVFSTLRTCRGCHANCATTGPNSGCSINGAGLCDGLCKPGYVYQNTTKTCAACDPQCASGCDLQGSGRCDSSCKSGYAFNNSTKRCLACDVNCASNCSLPAQCDSLCKPGYVLRNSWCQACDPNCIKTTGSCNNTGAGRCDSTCVRGYGLTSTFTCSACNSYCNLNATGCSEAGLCDPCSPAPCSSCISGYGIGNTTVSGKYSCYPCATKCSSGCDHEGAGCCDSSCSTGTWQLSPTNPNCHICN